MAGNTGNKAAAPVLPADRRSGCLTRRRQYNVDRDRDRDRRRRQAEIPPDRLRISPEQKRRQDESVCGKTTSLRSPEEYGTYRDQDINITETVGYVK